jgi:hypothetical protein
MLGLLTILLVLLIPSLSFAKLGQNRSELERYKKVTAIPRKGLSDDGYAHFFDEVLKDNPLYASFVFYDIPRSGIVGVRYEAGLVVEEVREVHVDLKSVHEALKQSTGTSQWKRKGELPGQWEIYASNDGKFVAYVSSLNVPWDVKLGTADTKSYSQG